MTDNDTATQAALDKSLLKIFDNNGIGFTQDDRAKADELLARGANVNARWEAGMGCSHSPGATPLMLAAQTREHFTGAVEYLLHKNADVHAVDEKGNNAAMYNVRSFHEFYSLQSLVKAGVDLRAQNDSKQTAFAIARAGNAESRVLELVKPPASTSLAGLLPKSVPGTKPQPSV